MHQNSLQGLQVLHHLAIIAIQYYNASKSLKMTIAIATLTLNTLDDNLLVLGACEAKVYRANNSTKR